MEPLVSICCITYNHEKYIADALDSFLMQETSFPFEIIVHDDASTDKTSEIIAKYEKEYPGIVKPIYQKENKHSQGKNPLRDFVLPLVKGKYIATCEGDDFWIDRKKIQKQVELLENNQDYIMCFHKVKVVDTSKKPLGNYLGLKSNGSKKIGVQDAAKGGVVHVSSRLIKTDFLKKPKPNWIIKSPLGGYDFASALYMAAEGQMFYIDEVMSAYRSGVENSIMTNFRINYSKENDINYNLNRIETLKMADEYYGFKYHDDIEKVKLLSYVIINLLSNDFSSLAIKNYKQYIYEHSMLRFIKLFLFKKFPTIANFLLKIKRKFSLMKNEQVN